ncbi:MAG: Eco57I restriction-modification methylase domain-containing protein [Candidatus Kapaibacterium sp.]
MNYLFQHKYTRDNYTTIIRDVFPHYEELSNPEQITEINNSLAKKAYKLGDIKLACGKEIAVYETVLSSNCNLSRNRVGIRNLLRNSWKLYDGAFIASYKPAENEWRFSFLSETKGFDDKATYAKHATQAKRYTYLFGEKHPCRTANERFEILKASNKELKDIIEAFSVETLSNEFFQKYKEIYADFVQYITGKRYIKKGSKWEEKLVGKPNKKLLEDTFNNDEKAVRDYVKKMMGRLVFLQFLQKKGWLDVPVDKDWGVGNKNYLQDLFKNSKHQDNFLEKVLEPLFFKVLNKERTNDIATNIPETNGKFPYLNGGLFEKDIDDEREVVFPKRYFKNLIEFLGEYNFTIDENDPNDLEIGIDPEMLGKIFENLLEDNKDKGAYYTPKEIVQYMCQESLVAYLLESKDDDKKIRSFVTTHNTEDFTTDEKKHLIQKLKDVKICDPAIGSGAFPMGMLNELFACRTALEGDTPNLAQIKREIIQNNIYGVDIEKGAIDIARLRFWLAIVVDSDVPEPLPNFDYKFMQGNSLIENFEDIDLSNIFEEQSEGKQMKMMFDEENYAIKLLRKNLDIFFNETNHYKKQSIKKELNNNVKQLIRAKTDKKDVLKKLENIDVSATDKFFLWHTWFADVFYPASKQGGFDIVIGNPPYVEAKKLKHIASTLKECFLIYSGTADLSIYFIEKGLDLLKRNGVLCYITTNKFFNTIYGEPVRELLSKQNINHIINFEQVEVFEGILVSSVILNIQNCHSEKNNKFIYEKFYKLKAKEFKVKFLERQNSFGSYRQKYLDKNEWSFADVSELLLKEKIEKNAINLKNIDGVSVYRGVTTGFNPAFIISDKKRDELIEKDTNNAQVIKKLLQGRNIRKWYYNESDENLILTRRGIKIADYPIIESYLRQFFNKLKPKTKSTEEEGRKPGNYKWFEILDNTAYYKHFERSEKIIWGLTADKWAFAYDDKQHYLPSNGYILTSENVSVKYLLGLLNSKLLQYYFGFIGVMTAGGAYTLKAATIEALPIIISNEQPIISLVNKILNAKQENPQADTSEWEKEIDQLVYQLYGLTDEEIKVIEEK